MQPHLDELARNRRRLLRPKDYGLVDRKEWEKHLLKFVTHVLRPSDWTARFKPDPMLAAIVEREIDVFEAAVASGALTSPSGNAMTPSTAGVLFEQECADRLAARGWRCQVTKGSGDQGVDVVAERARFRVAIQCKRYANPVGNAAVQEVVSGAKFYSCRHAVVISTAGYTRSAFALAAATHVLLADAVDLDRLEILLQKQPPVHP